MTGESLYGIDTQLAFFFRMLAVTGILKNKEELKSSSFRFAGCMIFRDVWTINIQSDDGYVVTIPIMEETMRESLQLPFRCWLRRDHHLNAQLERNDPYSVRKFFVGLLSAAFIA
jgi:hypothetical protein